MGVCSLAKCQNCQFNHALALFRPEMVCLIYRDEFDLICYGSNGLFEIWKLLLARYRA